MAKLEFRWAVLIITTILALLYVQTIRYTDCKIAYGPSTRTWTGFYKPAYTTVCIDRLTGKAVRR